MTAPDETAAASRGRKPRSPEAQLQRREEIMRSALACFKRKGFHNVSMADIAREDGMSVGNLYNFFENKDAIIEAFAEREILRIRRHLCTDSEHYEEQEACKRDVYELTLARGSIPSRQDLPWKSWSNPWKTNGSGAPCSSLSRPGVKF